MRIKDSKTLPDGGKFAFYYDGAEETKQQCCCIKCGFFSPNLKYQLLTIKDNNLSAEEKNISVICQLCYFAENIEWALKGQLIDIIYFPELTQVEVNKLVRRIYCNQYANANEHLANGVIGVKEWNDIVKARGDDLFTTIKTIGKPLNTNDGWTSLFKALEPSEREIIQSRAQAMNLRVVAKSNAFSNDELNHFNSSDVLTTSK